MKSEEELLSMKGLNQEELTEDGTKRSSHRCHGNRYRQSSKKCSRKAEADLNWSLNADVWINGPSDAFESLWLDVL